GLERGGGGGGRRGGGPGDGALGAHARGDAEDRVTVGETGGGSTQAPAPKGNPVRREVPLIRTALPSERAAQAVESPGPAAPAAEGVSAESARPGQPAAHLVTRGFGLRYGNLPALHDISLDIPEHRVTAIIGPSGCGKSTLIRAFNRMNDVIAGVRTTGLVRVGTLDVNAPSTDVVALRRRVGMVFQRPNPFPQSVFDNVAFGLRLLGVRQHAALDER